jgi:hypothetical protein
MLQQIKQQQWGITPCFNSLILITGKVSFPCIAGYFCNAKPFKKSAISDNFPTRHPSGSSS